MLNIFLIKKYFNFKARKLKKRMGNSHQINLQLLMPGRLTYLERTRKIN